MPPVAPSITQSLVVEELATLAELDALRPEWARLWAASDATPFQSPAWLVPWWRHFGQGAPRVLTLRRGGSLVGVVPLYTLRGDGERRLLLIGTGNTDHLDGTFAPGVGPGAAETVVARLARCRDEWDVCDLQRLRPASPLLAASLPAHVEVEQWEEEPCPVAPLPCDVDALPDGLRRGVWKRLAYARRRAGRAGRVSFEAASDGNLAELLDALFRLHGARWETRGEGGVLADHAVRAFHADACAELLALGALRMWALRLDDRIIGVHYGLADRGCAYYYIGGFDPEHEKLSPGTILLGHAMEQAVRDGARELDFLRGREAYKYAWGAVDRPSWRRVLRERVGVPSAPQP